MKDAIYSTKQISQNKKLRIPNMSLINSSILRLAMAQLRNWETTPRACLFCVCFLRLWKVWFCFEHPSSFCFNFIYSDFYLQTCFSPLSWALFDLQRVKRQHYLCRSWWETGVLDELFLICLPLKKFCFWSSPLDDERHWEERGLLSLFSRFSCLYQCFILILHSSLSFFPFSTVAAFCLGNK